MSLYERMYDATTEAEGYREIAAAAETVATETAAETVATETAVEFLVWFKEAQNDEWIRYATNEEIFEQFKMGL
jgi:hypothetical protein